MFSVKNAVVYTFFGWTSVQNTVFSTVFNALASKNTLKYRYLRYYLIFGNFFSTGNLPKWLKMPFQYILKLRHPKIVEKPRKHHMILVSVRNRFSPLPN